MESGKDKMERAVAVLSSAASHCNQIHKRWEKMPRPAQTEAAHSSPNPAQFFQDMCKVKQHEEYCLDIIDKARETLDMLQEKREELDAKMAAIAEEKKKMAASREEEVEQQQIEEQERRQTIEEDALRLINNVVPDIGLGANLEQNYKPPKELGGEPKTKVVRDKKKIDIVQRGEIDVDAVVGDLDVDAVEYERGEDGELRVKEGTVRAKSKAKAKAKGAKKLSKKEKKALKKMRKKEKKRKKRGYASGSDEEKIENDPDVPTQPIPTVSTEELPSHGKAKDDDDAKPVLPVLETEIKQGEAQGEQEGVSDDAPGMKVDDEDKKRRKKEKKASKKEAKQKKKALKKQRKRQKRGRSESDEGSDNKDDVAKGDVAGQDQGEQGVDMEKELFGSEEED